MSGKTKTMENNHICKFFGFEQSGSTENSERMEEFNEEDIWGSSSDPETKQVGFQENGCQGVAQCRSMGKIGLQENGCHGVAQSRSMGKVGFQENGCHGVAQCRSMGKIGFQENGCHGVAQCRSMGKEGNSNNDRKSVKIHRDESCHEENSCSRRTRYQCSAPVTIPDWSQLTWKDKKSENYWRSTHGVDDNSDGEEENDVRDFERIPPHELIARQLDQSKTSSFSVYEGVGRALKGRDLSRVRNAVWMRTGFIE